MLLGRPGRLGVRLVDRFRRTDSLSLYPALAASQWEAPALLRARQWEALQRLLEHAVAKVPYYRRVFGERGLSPADIREPADLARLPVLDKATIRTEGDAMLAEDFAAHQPRPKATSGSTGVPLRYWIDRSSHGHHWAFIWRAWSQVGFAPGDPWAALSGGALLPAKVDFRQRVYLWLNGALHLPSYHLREEDFPRYARILAAGRAKLLYAYPSSLQIFSRWLADTGRSVPPVPLFTTSEALPPAWRAEIEAATGGELFDIYGNNDGGILAFECGRHDGYHVNDEGVFVEVVDDGGSPLPAGAPGEILSTNLLNYAMPFIRYAPGDGAALLPEPCRCGRGLTRLGALEGRVRDVVLTPDGRKVHGAFFNHFEPFYASPWIDAFQVRQREAGAITLILQTGRPPERAELDTLLAELRRGLGEEMAIEIEMVDEIPRGPAGKYRLIVSEIGEAP